MTFGWKRKSVPPDGRRLRYIGSGVAMCLLLSACGETRGPEKAEAVIRPVKLMTVGAAHSGNIRTMPGSVRAADRVDLAFQVSGPLVDLPVREGQRVRKGALLARLDPRDYETNLRNAQGVLAKAKARLEYDTAEYRRYLKVRQTDAGAVSESLLALKLAAAHVSRADVQSAEATVAAARDQLAYTYLRAPFDGVVARRYADNYQEMQAKQPVLSLQNVSDVEVLLDVPELAVAPIRKTEPRFYAEFAADPNRRFALKVKEFATEADALTQTYRVVLVMPAPQGIRILPGMTATVAIEFGDSALAGMETVVPAIAIFADEAGRPAAWVVDADTMTVKRRAVTTGALSGSDGIRIISGLKAGDMIAVSGVSKLREGQKVRPFDVSAAAEDGAASRPGQP